MTGTYEPCKPELRPGICCPFVQSRRKRYEIEPPYPVGELSDFVGRRVGYQFYDRSDHCVHVTSQSKKAVSETSRRHVESSSMYRLPFSHDISDTTYVAGRGCSLFGSAALTCGSPCPLTDACQFDILYFGLTNGGTDRMQSSSC